MRWKANVRFNGAAAQITCSLVEAWPPELSVNWIHYVADLPPTQRTQNVRDALAYMILSSEKWASYAAERRAMSSLPRTVAQLRINPTVELVGAIVATAGWYPCGRSLGLALIRRTWCNHLAIDFLAVHPRLSTTDRDVSGVGSALLSASSDVAAMLRVDKVWLETTSESVDYYRVMFQQPELKDLLVIDRAKFARPLAKVTSRTP